MALLLAAALLVRALVPAGWMVGSTADGVGLVLCDGLAPETADAHAGMHHAPADQGEPEEPAPDVPCAFAGLAAAHEPVTPIGLDHPSPATAVVTPILPSATPGRGLAAPPPPATGPPALA